MYFFLLVGRYPEVLQVAPRLPGGDDASDIREAALLRVRQSQEAAPVQGEGLIRVRGPEVARRTVRDDIDAFARLCGAPGGLLRRPSTNFPEFSFAMNYRPFLTAIIELANEVQSQR